MRDRFWRLAHHRQLKRGMREAEQHLDLVYACALGLVCGWADARVGEVQVGDLSGAALSAAAEILKMNEGWCTHAGLDDAFELRRSR